MERKNNMSAYKRLNRNRHFGLTPSDICSARACSTNTNIISKNWTANSELMNISDFSLRVGLFDPEVPTGNSRKVIYVGGRLVSAVTQNHWPITFEEDEGDE